MIACTFISDGRNGNNEFIFYVVIVQYSTGTEQNKFFSAHSNNFFKSYNTGRRSYSGEVESNVCIFITDFVNRYHTICSI